MPFFHSLFCLKGFDDRQRFLSITVANYVLFMIISAMFSEQLFISFLLLTSFVAFSGITTLRRLNDAHLNNRWLIGSCATYFIAGSVILLTESSSFYWLMVVPSLFSALLLTYPSKANNHYILGYSGPIDLSDYQQLNQTQLQRIEPIFNGGKANNEANIHVEPNSEHQTSTFQQSTDKQPDVGEIIREKLFSNKNAVITMISIVVIVISAMIISNIISYFNSTEKIIEEPVPIKKVVERTNKITFEDNFSLLTSSANGLIINWSSSSEDDATLWSIETANGDKSCGQIRFNNKKEIRTIDVVIENDGDYFASFSPLDTEFLLQEIALRGSFSLCDFTFSLKGSQSVLGKNMHYMDLMNK